MKEVLIIEHNTNSLQLNESTSPKDRYLLGGEFTRFNVTNRNDRIYTPEGFLPALKSLQEDMKQRTIYGEFDHPTDFTMSLSRTSHAIKEITYNKEKNIVEGKIHLLATHHGRDAMAIVDGGYPLFVSSRAAGITESNGTVTLKKLFTYDLVSDPGFATAKMSTINESLGYSNNSNYYMYEIANESDINKLFEMNKNDILTRRDLDNYSEYLTKQFEKANNDLNKAIKEGREDQTNISKMVERLESLMEAKEKMETYLDYLSNKVKHYIGENSSLKDEIEKLKEHNTYIVNGINETTEKVENVSENLETTTSILSDTFNNAVLYMEHIATGLNKVNENISDKLKKSILFTEYIAENLNTSIEFTEYVAENTKKNIDFSEYIAENVQKNREYANYLAENLDNSIVYNDYLAENLDKSLGYMSLITDKLNTKVNESVDSEPLPTLEDFGFGNDFDYFDDEEDDDIFGDDEIDELDIDEIEEIEGDESEFEVDDDVVITNDDDIFVGGNMEDDDSDDEEIISDDEKIIGTLENLSNDEETDEDIIEDETLYIESETILTQQINELINEAKKRKKLEQSDAHFLTFLERKYVNSFNDLTEEEQEAVKIYISERQYFNQQDVLRLISEALSAKNETIEEKLDRLMPEKIRQVWDQLSEKQQNSIYSQAKLWKDNLETDEQIEHFWETRNIKLNTTTKKMVSNDQLVVENKLTDDEIAAMMSRFRHLIN